ncbi:hypothetical protein G155_00211 [Mycobacterium sp. VKM Ac-1817D]|nr:hypothetical protein G155_00211 [Mycobacterium sp. VKM Ac-1817D]
MLLEQRRGVITNAGHERIDLTRHRFVRTKFKNTCVSH